MDIRISFDYELFFGSVSGSAKKCIIEPTQKLIDIASKYHVPFIFFVDAGYLVQLKKIVIIVLVKKIMRLFQIS